MFGMFSVEKNWFVWSQTRWYIHCFHVILSFFPSLVTLVSMEKKMADKALKRSEKWICFHKNTIEKRRQIKLCLLLESIKVNTVEKQWKKLLNEERIPVDLRRNGAVEWNTCLGVANFPLSDPGTNLTTAFKCMLSPIEFEIRKMLMKSEWFTSSLIEEIDKQMDN